MSAEGLAKIMAMKAEEVGDYEPSRFYDWTPYLDIDISPVKWCAITEYSNLNYLKIWQEDNLYHAHLRSWGVARGSSGLGTGATEQEAIRNALNAYVQSWLEYDAIINSMYKD